MTLELGILGDLIGVRAGQPVAIPRGMSQRLLLALAVDRDRSVTDDELVDRLWGPTAPPNALASLRNIISRVRTLLGADVIERHTVGYRLSTSACSLDVDRFDSLVGDARRHLADDDGDAALEALDTALALVRGRAIGQVADEWWAMAAAHELTERVALAEELWAEIRLRYDRTGRELGRMHQAARSQPHRELRWRQLMQGLAAAGRRTEALRVATEAKRALSEFGLSPGPEILALERELLGAPHDMSTADVHTAPTANRLASMRAGPFVGRDRLLRELADARDVVWLEGEPGIGKTRLLSALSAEATGCGDLVLYGACERSAAAGTQLIVDIAQAALLAAPRGQRIPIEVAALLGHDNDNDDDTGNAHLEPEVRRARLRTGVLRLLTGVAAERPVLVLADDVHWIDDEAADFVLYLVDRAPPTVRWVFAGRRRAERTASLHLHSALIRRAAVHEVTMQPLVADDLRQLVRILAPDTDDATRDAIADEVAGSSSGNALLATELIAHRLARPNDRTTPPRLDAIVASMLDTLSGDELQLVTTLAVAGPRCPPQLLSEAVGRTIEDTLTIADRVAATGLLAPLTPSSIEFRHEVLADVVRSGLDLATESTARRRLIDAAARDPRHVVALADHLLELGDLVNDLMIEQRHRAVAAAVAHLAKRNDNEQAAAMGRRYLALTTDDRSLASTEAKLRIATVLIAGGSVAEGSSLLDALAPRAKATGDPVLRTDLALARGPLQTGGTHANEIATEAEELLTQLPPTEVDRRVQLACWAAHHRLNQGNRAHALELLAGIECLELPASSPYLRGLVLAIRAQADLMLVTSPGPDAVHQSMRALHDYVTLTDDEASAAAESVLGLGAAFMSGTFDDVAEARAAIERSAVGLPRSDLRWWPLVSDAAVLLAAGDLDTASPAIERAIQQGTETGVEMAVRTGLMQRALHMLLGGTLGSIAGMMEAQASAADAPTTMVAFYGLACIEAHDHIAARHAAEALRARLPVLASSGIAWPNVAMAACEVAHFVNDVDLAASLWDELERWSGSGLSVMGAAYFGSVDAALGQLALTMGRVDDGVDLLRRAQQRERACGWTAWERRVTALLDSFPNH